MSQLVWDIETNGFLEKLDRVHCGVTKHVYEGPLTEYRPTEIERALTQLEEADEIIGHHIIGFDIPAVQKVYPGWEPRGKVTDTLVMSKLVYPNMRERDWAKKERVEKKGGTWMMPLQLMGRHSLEAWGHRLGFHKGNYMKDMKAKGIDPWAEFNEDMLSYCVNDVELNVKLYKMLIKSGWSQQSFDLEHSVYSICRRQEAHGCSFDEDSAQELYLRINKEKWEVENRLKKAFGSWYQADSPHDPESPETWFRPKRNHSGLGYIEGAPLTKLTFVEFNPGSRNHIAKRLQDLRGWEPKKHCPNGQPQIDESVLAGLKYPEARILNRYLMLNKRIGQIAEGKEAWLKLVKPDGRIYGRIDQNGTITTRASHSKPNLGQVPAVRSAFGSDCRALFRATPGLVMVGADASSLELCCLGHYLAHYDDGEYARAVSEGSQEEGTDAHTLNQKTAGLPTRDEAKTFIYALLYGAGDFTLGGGNRAKGRRLRTKFMKGIPAYGKLVRGIKNAAKKRGRLKSLDGRYLWVRSQHAALNTLLQGAGAVIMKQAMVNYHNILEMQGIEFDQVFWVHDEFQVECRPEVADRVGKAMVEGIRMVTDQLDLKCPLDGEYKIGPTWAETH